MVSKYSARLLLSVLNQMQAVLLMGGFFFSSHLYNNVQMCKYHTAWGIQPTFLVRLF